MGRYHQPSRLQSSSRIPGQRNAKKSRNVLQKKSQKRIVWLFRASGFRLVSISPHCTFHSFVQRVSRLVAHATWESLQTIITLIILRITRAGQLTLKVKRGHDAKPPIPRSIFKKIRVSLVLHNQIILVIVSRWICVALSLRLACRGATYSWSETGTQRRMAAFDTLETCRIFFFMACTKGKIRESPACFLFFRVSVAAARVVARYGVAFRVSHVHLLIHPNTVKQSEKNNHVHPFCWYYGWCLRRNENNRPNCNRSYSHFPSSVRLWSCDIQTRRRDRKSRRKPKIMNPQRWLKR